MMMSQLDEQQMRALAFLVSRRRPAHADRWDEPGIMAALRRIQDLDGEEVIHAAIRAAANPANHTPAVIPLMGAEHWQQLERPGAALPDPVDPAELCAHCGQTEHGCRRNPHSGHAYESVADYDERIKLDRAIRAGLDPETGELTLDTEGASA